MSRARRAFFPAVRRLAALLLCACAFRARAADADYKRILIEGRRDAVEVRLPLTDVTGSARIKQRAADGFGIPIAPSRTNLDTTCYLECQIGYDTTDADDVSVVPSATPTPNTATS